MNPNTLISLCWIVLGLSALVLIGGAAIGAAYHPEAALTYLLAACGPVILVGALLYCLPRVQGPLWVLVIVLLACTGFGLVGVFGYRLTVDGGDALLWTPPLLLGIGLLALVGTGGSPQKLRGKS
jgi:hypothetical protein